MTPKDHTGEVWTTHSQLIKGSLYLILWRESRYLRVLNLESGILGYVVAAELDDPSAIPKNSTDGQPWYAWERLT